MSRLLALIVLVGLVLAGLYYRRDLGLGTPESTNATLDGVETRLGEVGRTVGAKVRDTTLTGKVKAAFELNRTVEPYDLDVAADGRSVVLRGEVPDQAVSDAAARIAADVPGVDDVRNEIRVAGGAPPPPSPAAANPPEKSVGARRAKPARATAPRTPSAAP